MKRMCWRAGFVGTGAEPENLAIPVSTSGTLLAKRKMGFVFGSLLERNLPSLPKK
jgi:hypothetical protein